MTTQEAPPKPTAPPLRERGRFDLVHDYEGEVQSCSHGQFLPLPSLSR